MLNKEGWYVSFEESAHGGSPVRNVDEINSGNGCGLLFLAAVR